MTKPKRIRALDSLLGGGGTAADGIKDPATSVPLDKEALQNIPINKLTLSPNQPRSQLDPIQLAELSSSIKTHGVMQPIVVRPLDNGMFEIIAGQRRWRASEMAGLTVIPAVIREVSEQVALAMALIENIQREDLNPIEEAVSLERLQNEFSLKHAEVAEAVGKSRTAVTNLLRLLKLSHSVRAMVEHGEIDMGHARCLLSLEAASQLRMASDIIAEGLSVRQTEERVRQLLEPTAERTVIVRDRNAERALSTSFGCDVRVTLGKPGEPKISISCEDKSSLKKILKKLNPN